MELLIKHILKLENDLLKPKIRQSVRRERQVNC